MRVRRRAQPVWRWWSNPFCGEKPVPTGNDRPEANSNRPWSVRWSWADFAIEERIGSGGFGPVYRAWDDRLQRPVAVKVIDRERRRPRVTREAQAVARLTHRNIATLYELASDGERAFLVSGADRGETPCDRSAGGASSPTAWSLASAPTRLRR